MQWSTRCERTEFVCKPQGIIRRGGVEGRDEPMNPAVLVLANNVCGHWNRRGDGDFDLTQFSRSLATGNVVPNPAEAAFRRFKISEEAVPPVAVSGGTPRAASAHPSHDDGRVGLLHRARLRINAAEGEEAALVRRLLHRPEGLDRLNRFIRHRAALLERGPDRAEFGLKIPRPQAEDEPAL